MSETNGKVVANIQKQLESAKVWANTSNSDKMLKLLFCIKQKCMVKVQWQFCLVYCMLGRDLNLGAFSGSDLGASW